MSKNRVVIRKLELPSTAGTGSICNHQCQITFSNGWTISMIYGTGAYCGCSGKFDDGCETVEIAIMNANHDLVEFKSGDTVKGWTHPDELPEIMQWIKNQKENAKNVS